MFFSRASNVSTSTVLHSTAVVRVRKVCPETAPIARIWTNVTWPIRATSPSHVTTPFPDSDADPVPLVTLEVMDSVASVWTLLQGKSFLISIFSSLKKLLCKNSFYSLKFIFSFIFSNILNI